jgi:hypothetical protein
MAIRPIGGKYEGYGNCVDIIDRVDGHAIHDFRYRC